MAVERALVVDTRNGKVTDATPTAMRLLGVEPGRRIDDFFPDEQGNPPDGRPFVTLARDAEGHRVPLEVTKERVDPVHVALSVVPMTEQTFLARLSRNAMCFASVVSYILALTTLLTGLNVAAQGAHIDSIPWPQLSIVVCVATLVCGILPMRRAKLAAAWVQFVWWLYIGVTALLEATYLAFAPAVCGLAVIAFYVMVRASREMV